MRRLQLCVIALTALIIAPTAFAATISLPANVDLLTVQPGSFANISGPYAIPADFFGPGSDPFTGIVQLVAVQAGPDPACPGGGAPDPADIIIKRDPIMLADFPSGAIIDIEIVQMELVSAEPITVTYNGGQNPEQWNLCLRVPLPGEPQPMPRRIDLDRDTELGGDFSTTYAYDMIYRLTRTIAPVPPDPPIEYTPPPDTFSGGGRWGIPALPFPSPSSSSGTTLVCPACKTDQFYLGYDGSLPESFVLSGSLLTLNVIITCSAAIPVDETTWGEIKNRYHN